MSWSLPSTPVPAHPTPGAAACLPRNSPRKSARPTRYLTITAPPAVMNKLDLLISSQEKKNKKNIKLRLFYFKTFDSLTCCVLCVLLCRLRSVSDSALRKTHADQISVSSSGSSSSDMEDLSGPQPTPFRLKLKVRLRPQRGRWGSGVENFKL